MEDDELFAAFDEGSKAAPASGGKRPPAAKSERPAGKKARQAGASAAAHGGANSGGGGGGGGGGSGGKPGPRGEAKGPAPSPAQGGAPPTAEPAQNTAAAVSAVAPDASASKAITHEVALPPGDYEPDPGIYTLEHPPCKPAREYPFELDPFQKAAKAAIERNESVLVAAHTSAGKTVCAEYAIATALRAGARVIYTSPIKALSNQKYRELLVEFGSVGLMTGDVTINPSAECLVMTTEILRSMLYRGSEVMREVSWVIFDEVHYLRDKERGVVWEETMILVPPKVRFVFLSATIPNALEFAQWVASLHTQPCHVVYTDYRPTPLKHYVFAEGGSGLHLVREGEGPFKSANFEKALAELVSGAEGKEAANKHKVKAKAGKGVGSREQQAAAADIAKIVKIGHALSLFPLIVFALSKRECESLALGLDKLDTTTDDEKALIGEIFANAIEPLSEDDKGLPQVAKLLPILRRGVGIHHGGLLPLIKEVVELLFQEGLIKVLFATETFAMGLNMPARTVVFANGRKFDGEEFRLLAPGEYIQMSGRAGRRGIDATGVVIFRMERKVQPASVRTMVTGRADTLTSSFQLSYNMVLNCLRLETGDVQMLMRKSFHTYQQQRAAPDMEAEREALAAEVAALRASQPDDTLELCAEREALLSARRSLRDERRAIANAPATVWPFVVPGRLASVRDAEHDWGWGMIVDGHGPPSGRRAAGAKAGGADAELYTLDMLVPVHAAALRGDEAGCAPGTPRPVPLPTAEQLWLEGGADAAAAAGAEAAAEPGDGGVDSDERIAAYLARAELVVVRVRLDELDELSSVRVHLPKEVRTADARCAVLKTAVEVVRRFDGGVPSLDAKDDLHIAEGRYFKLCRKLEGVEERLRSTRFNRLDSAALGAHARIAELTARRAALAARLKESKESSMTEQLKCMKRVLRRLGHTNADNVIELKGRVACEVSTADELMVTELLFTGTLTELSAEQIVSLMSCLVAVERSADSDDAKVTTPAMKAPVEALQNLARRVGQVKLESKLPIDVDEYVKGFSVQLVDLTFEWCHGKRFVDLMMMTKQYEGSIIRMLHRLEELLRQLITSARAIGDAELEDKCTRGAALLRRDIVFAASLYLDDTTGPAKGAGAPPVAAAPNGPSSAEGAARAEGAQTVLTTIKPQEPANGGP